jgi:hypothetical protein
MAEAKPPASHGEQKDTPRVRYLTLAYGGIACFVGAVLSWALALIMVGLAEIIAIGY